MKNLALTIVGAAAFIGCSGSIPEQSDASFSDSGSSACLDLSRLQTEDELVSDRALCPTIYSFYQDRLHDDSSSNINAPGCFVDVGCPNIQLECPYARFGGEEACNQANVRDCVLFLRDATNNGFGLDDIEEYLRCNCRC